MQSLKLCLTSAKAEFRHCDIKLPGKLRLVVWGVGLAALISITVYDLMEIIDGYTNKNVAIDFKVIADVNSTPPLPRLALMILYDSLYRGEEILHAVNKLQSSQEENCIVCHQLRNHSWDVWRKFNISNQ